MSRDIALAISKLFYIGKYRTMRFLHIQSGRVEKVVKVRCSVVIYCGFYQRLIGGFNFGCFLIVVLKWFIFCDRRAKELEVLKYISVNVLFCS